MKRCGRGSAPVCIYPTSASFLGTFSQGRRRVLLPLTRELSSVARLRERKLIFNFGVIFISPSVFLLRKNPPFSAPASVGASVLRTEVSTGHPHPNVFYPTSVSLTLNSFSPREKAFFAPSDKT